MKIKYFLAFVVLVTLSFSSFAQRPSVSATGRISIGGGRTIVGISVGEGRANREQLTRRILRLEQAVRDLQIQVYNLSQSDLPSRERWECKVTAFSDTYFGRGNSQNLARSNAQRACLEKRSSMFCKDDDIRCSQLN